MTMTTSERSKAMVAAAHRRHEETRRKAIDVLRRLDADGEPVSFVAVARTAGISRAWLYRDADIRAEIERLRDLHLPPARPRVPFAERASASSLRQELGALRTREAELRNENRLLREALARKYGEERAAQLINPG
jgi:hypothetical protein